MSEFIKLLNDNQGILEFISLIIKLVGLFIVNENIKINHTINHSEDRRIIMK